MTGNMPTFASPKLAGAAYIAAGVPTGIPPNFQQVAVQQLMLNWCWAAVGAAVSFCADEESFLSQCQVGNLVKFRLGSAASEALDWCQDRQTDSLPTAMNKQATMPTVLNEVAVPIVQQRNWPCFPDILNWVTTPRHLCPILVSLPGGVPHFILAIGVSNAAITIYDPSELTASSGHLVTLSEAKLENYGGGQFVQAYFI